MLGHLVPEAAAAAVTEQGQVGARRDAPQHRVNGRVHGQRAELDEVVARAAGAKLPPGYVAEAAGNRVLVPGRIVQNFVLARGIPLTARAEDGLLLQRRPEAFAALVENLRGG